MLDTGFGNGGLFFETWQAWAADPQRPRLLHYVAITPAAPDRDAVLLGLSAFPLLAQQAAGLGRQWFGLLPGFHRIVLQYGQVLLTLCIGPLQAMLREQQFVADAVCLALHCDAQRLAGWDRWCIKALTRLCRQGTAISVLSADPPPLTELTKAGFVLDEDHPHDNQPGASPVGPAAALHGRYQPPWEPGATRHTWRVAPPAASSCVVVGAGLAGATVAAALARRGWQVTVLDGAAQPAAGASSLPVGLIAPRVSRDDNPASRLSRAGMRATLALCRDLLQPGEDWALTGVLELRPDGAPGLPHDWPAEGRHWSTDYWTNSESAAWSAGLANNAASIWHTAAGWIKPARLVQACLAQVGVQFIGRSGVYAIMREADLWVLMGAGGKLLAQAPQLVLAAAGDSVRLLDAAAGAAQPGPARIHRLAAMGELGGQVSWARQEGSDVDVFPPFPVNGLGSFVAHVPVGGAAAWFAGATYQPGSGDPYSEPAVHRDNLARVACLLPPVAERLAGRFAAAQVQVWSGTRCTTIDRLPAAGALDSAPQPSLWVSTGMGSRGLTYAALCAEMLAAQLSGEPLPVEASLARCLAATRPRLLHHL